MNKATLTEYGASIDPHAMVVPPDATELEWEPGHPGLGDEAYIRRRNELFALCRKHRLEQLGRRSSSTRRKKPASGRSQAEA